VELINGEIISEAKNHTELLNLHICHLTGISAKHCNFLKSGSNLGAEIRSVLQYLCKTSWFWKAELGVQGITCSCLQDVYMTKSCL